MGCFHTITTRKTVIHKKQRCKPAWLHQTCLMIRSQRHSQEQKEQWTLVRSKKKHQLDWRGHHATSLQQKLLPWNHNHAWSHHQATKIPPWRNLHQTTTLAPRIARGNRGNHHQTTKKKHHDGSWSQTVIQRDLHQTTPLASRIARGNGGSHHQTTKNHHQRTKMLQFWLMTIFWHWLCGRKNRSWTSWWLMLLFVVVNWWCCCCCCCFQKELARGSTKFWNYEDSSAVSKIMNVVDGRWKGMGQDKNQKKGRRTKDKHAICGWAKEGDVKCNLYPYKDSWSIWAPFVSWLGSSLQPWMASFQGITSSFLLITQAWVLLDQCNGVCCLLLSAKGNGCCCW